MPVPGRGGGNRFAFTVAVGSAGAPDLNRTKGYDGNSLKGEFVDGRFFAGPPSSEE